MRLTLARALIAAVALALSGAVACSFVEDYDYESKPCNSEYACRPGYVCVKYDTTTFYCEPGAPDGGASASGHADAH